MQLFDAYLIVDWSAAAVPRRGRDSIWWALLRRDGPGPRPAALENPPTRAAATAALAEILRRLVAEDCHVLAGFDFPFGYPAGFAARLGWTGEGAGWRHVWDTVAERLRDGPDNANDRFDLGEALNREGFGEAFPFWGHDGGRERRFLARGGRRPHRPDDIAERRLADRRVPRAQPVWKLAYTGSVGSQALTGLPRLRALRDDPVLAPVARVWPFETGLAPLARDGTGGRRVVLAEVYPSIVAPASLQGRPRDAGQVVAAAAHFAALDDEGALAGLFAGDPGLDAAGRAAVEGEEGWILGIDGDGIRRPRAPAIPDWANAWDRLAS